MDGQQFSLDEELTDHPNGRCFKQPVIKGLESIQWQSGAEWFAQQSEETQRAMMGPKRYEAWKAGAFEFIELARRSESDVWGPSVRIAGLDELLTAKTSDWLSDSFTIQGVRIEHERQMHWRERHPEVKQVSEIDIIRAAIEIPSLEITSKSNPEVTIKYTKDKSGKWWAVVIAHPQDQQSFVLTVRRAHGPGK